MIDSPDCQDQELEDKLTRLDVLEAILTLRQSRPEATVVASGEVLRTWSPEDSRFLHWDRNTHQWSSEDIHAGC